MARNRGPKSKISRKYGEPILGFCKALQKKNYGPGEHGNKRKKESEFCRQQKQKQKVKYLYDILEKSLRRLFREASKSSEITGLKLLQLLETRLLNIVYRLNLAKTRRAARQLVSHGHIQINGKKINIPSQLVKPGDIIGLSQKSKELPSIQENLKKSQNKLDWLVWDNNLLQGKILKIPSRESIPEKINEQIVVEYYSK